MGANLSSSDQQSLIIGLTIGLIALAVIIIIIVICCCCRKVERSWLKRKFKRENKKFEQQKNEMTEAQARRREELDKRHTDIRNKYGLPTSNSTTATSSTSNPFETNSNVKYGVNNDEVNMSIR